MEFKSRKNIRLKEYDYNSAGSYFITFCVQDRKKILSHIHVGALHEAPEIELTEYGKLVKSVIETAEKRFGVTVDGYVIMPNHVHIIFTVKNCEERAIHESPLRGRSVVSKVVGYIKMNSSKMIHNINSEINIWQRSYYDHIIRNEADFAEKQNYILNNPSKWLEDEYYTEG